MFSWATSTLESLAQTVAPPPSDPNSRIYMACQKRDETTVFDILQQQHQQQQQEHQQGIHPSYTIINESKGYTLLHLACLYSLSQVVQYCLEQLQQQHYSSYLYITDQEGNTPLHCATMSNQPNALDIIKLLLSIESSSSSSSSSSSTTSPQTSDTNNNTPPIITIQNKSGKTPYDVATINSIRQYLLPIQLQAETQIAINNGGYGLPLGIDMGGLTIKNAAHLPPPPTASMLSSSTPPLATPQRVAYAPIPGLNVSPASTAISTTTTTTNATNTSGGLSHQQQQFDSSATVTASQQQPIPPTLESPYTTTMPLPVVPPPERQEILHRHRHQSSSAAAATTTTTNHSIPRAPNSTGSLSSSSSYALTGRSSAAIFSNNTTGSGRKGIQPDGFHSSSSDKNLQEKYGHVSNNSRTNLPPPPSSGNYTSEMVTSTAATTTTQQPLSAPLPSMSGSSYVNPFAGGVAVATTGGSAGAGLRHSGRRYVTYDPITTSNRLPSQQQQPTSMYSPYTQFQQTQQQQQPQQVFNPAFAGTTGNSFQQQQPALAESATPIIPTNSVSFTIPPAPFSASNNSSSSYSSPNAFIGKTPANTPMLSSSYMNTNTSTTPTATTTFMSPPPSGIATSFSNTGTPDVIAPRSFASSSPDRSGGSNAASVFGTPSSKTVDAEPITALSPHEVVTQQLHPQYGYHRSNSTTSDAAALFSKPIASTTTTTTDIIPSTQVSAPTTTELFSNNHDDSFVPLQQFEQQQQQQSTLYSEASTNVDGTTTGYIHTDEDDLDDVPLTPGQDANTNLHAPVMYDNDTNHEPYEQQQQQHEPPVQQPTSTAATASFVSNGVTSLISAIGMPPPPFSRK